MSPKRWALRGSPRAGSGVPIRAALGDVAAVAQGRAVLGTPEQRVETFRPSLQSRSAPTAPARGCRQAGAEGRPWSSEKHQLFRGKGASCGRSAGGGGEWGGGRPGGAGDRSRLQASRLSRPRPRGSAPSCPPAGGTEDAPPRPFRTPPAPPDPRRSRSPSNGGDAAQQQGQKGHLEGQRRPP